MNVYKPLPFRPGNKVVKHYVEFFDDGHGHTADITKVDYTDKKGKLIEGFTMYVKWRNNERSVSS